MSIDGVVIENLYDAMFLVTMGTVVVAIGIWGTSKDREAVGCAVLLTALVAYVGVLLLAYLLAHIRWIG